MELSDRFSYDPETGAVIRLTRDSGVPYWWNGRHGGKKIGTSRGDGYLEVSIDGRKVLVHRLAWYIHHGVWPAGEIDHRNGDRSDNRMTNLRDATKSQNSRNRSLGSNNKSGAIGVSRHGSGKWQAYISRGKGRQEYLGLYATFDLALAARKAAEFGHGFSERHGA